MKLTFYAYETDFFLQSFRYDRDTDELVDLPSVVPLQAIRDLIDTLDREAEGAEE